MFEKPGGQNRSQNLEISQGGKRKKSGHGFALPNVIIIFCIQDNDKFERLTLNSWYNLEIFKQGSHANLKSKFHDFSIYYLQDKIKIFHDYFL